VLGAPALLGRREKTRVIVADVSGHGVAAGFFSVMSSLLLHSVWCDPARSLAQVVSFLNDQLTSYSVNGICVSAILVQFDLRSREAIFVNAGHPPAYVIHKTGVRERVAFHGGAEYEDDLTLFQVTKE